MSPLSSDLCRLLFNNVYEPAIAGFFDALAAHYKGLIAGTRSLQNVAVHDARGAVIARSSGLDWSVRSGLEFADLEANEPERRYS